MAGALDAFLTAQVFAFLLVFARVGTAMMMMPAMGEAFISPQIRVLIALGFSLLLVPVLQPGLPPIPQSTPAFVVLLAGEVTVGVFFGMACRLLLMTLETAGSLISLQTGLSSAAMFNPALGIQGTPFGAMLGAMGLVMIFSTDLHHMMLGAIANSYELFRPGAPLPLNDMADTIARIVGQTFLIATRMAAPFIIGGMALNVALGVLARLVPQMQIFFVALPVQIAGGLLLFMVSLGAVMALWVSTFEQFLLGVFS